MQIKIGNASLGLESPVFVVAEISGNHGGSLDKALEIVRAAKRSGADAIKLQTYSADTITLKSDKADFLLDKNSPWRSYGNLWDLYNAAMTPFEWHEPIFEEARSLGLVAFSSPFDEYAVDFLEGLDVPAYKIASPEIVDTQLLTKVARTGKPVILSKGLAELKDIELALKTLRKGGCSQIILLQCNSSYPSPLSDSNLRVIADIPNRFGVLSGLSDHSEGDLAAITATAIGASMIEKHICISDGGNTVDSFFSLDENEFKAMIEKIRNVEISLGRVSYDFTESAKSSLQGRRSLYISKAAKAGDQITPVNIRSVRPSYGLHPQHYHDVIGNYFSIDVDIGDRLTWDSIKKK